MKTKLLLLLLLANFSIYAQVNLVPNGGLESWTGNVLQNWNVTNSVASSTDRVLGNYSAKLSFTTVSPKILAQVPMKAGVTYSVKFRYKYVSANYSGDHPIALNISKAGSASTLSSSTFATNNLWTEKATTFTADQDLSYDLSISTFSFDSKTFDVLIDDVQVYVQGTEQYTLIPDVEFEKTLISMRIDSGVPDGKVPTSNINALKSLDIASIGNNITNLTGIQDFAALTTLNCNFSQISTLDVSKNTLLTSLSLRFNKLTSIDLSKNTLLTNVDLYSNSLTTLDVSSNTALTSLVCGSNKLTVLDVSSNLNLIGLDCSGNKLKTLNVSKNTLLQTLICPLIEATSLDLSNNLALTDLDCSGNALKTLDVSKNTALIKLAFGSNNLTTIDLSKNTNLTFLDASSNLLETFDVTLNTNLEYLVGGNNGGNNKYTTLDVSKNTKLIELNLSRLPLKTLDVTKNIALKQLDCNVNNLTTLDVSANTALETLLLDGNKLTSLDVSKNKLLKDLSCSSNQLTSLDVSKNNSLVLLSAGYNKLISLNVKNGNNSNLLKNHGIYFRYFYGNAGLDYTFNFKGNIGLSCIQVDNVDYSRTNWETIKDAEAYYSSLDCNLSTNIADPKFEDKLIALGIDTDGKNGGVLNSSINTITSLDVSGTSISDLTGIQGFTALTNLNASANSLQKLDLSKNAVLNTLNTSSNAALTCIKVSDLAVTSNWNVTKDAGASFSLDCNVYTLIPDSKFEDKLIALQIDRDGKNGKVKTESIANILYLDLSLSNISDLTGIQDFTSLLQLTVNNNNLTSIDISKNLGLNYLNARSNQLTSVDVSKNVALFSLTLGSNFISNIDITKNINLTSLQVDNNKLSSLDLSSNTKLAVISAYNNSLVTIDVSKNTELAQLSCGDNQIRTLDLSKNTKLYSLYASNSKLVNVNVKNGTNVTLKLDAYFTGNPDLTCIQVDDVSYSNTNWATKKDATATFSAVACPVVVPYTLIPDSNFEDKLIALGIDKDGKNGKVATMSITSLTSLNVSNSNIADLAGIEDFTLLTSLECNNNLLTTINISKNLSLTKLNISNNKISVLNVASHTLLSNLNCSNNEILVLDVSKNTKLTNLSASFNKLKDLDVSKNTILKEFDCAGNDLYNLNLKNGNNANMQNVIFGNFTKNPNLLCIEVDDAAFSTDKWIAKDAIATYSTAACEKNYQYTLIPDANFERRLISSGLDSGVVDGKVLTSNIVNVKSLSAFGTPDKITDLTGIEDFASLENLSSYHEAITKIDLSKNVKLKTLDIADNKIAVLDLSKNTALESVNCGTNSLTELNVSNNLALKTLIASSNKLTSIDLSKNKVLTRLDISSNQISNLDVAANTALTYLDSYNNKIAVLDISKNLALTSLSTGLNALLTSVDVSKQTALTYLNVKSSQLTSIDVSNNKALTGLDVSSNKITAIDLSNNTALTSLKVNSNQLTSLNLKNGKNNLLTNVNVSFSGNSKLYCILVDDVTYANTNWTNAKDAIATFNTECSGELVLPANNFTVETKGESCLGENNGEISIVGKTALAYTATINDKAYTFTNNSLKVTALAPGIYNIMISVPGVIFEQNFTVTIVKGGTIAGKSTVTSKKVDVEITEGTAPFTVYIDGAEQFQTSESAFTLDLNQNVLLEVATSKACEGVYAKKIDNISSLSGVLTAYPNPTSGSFEVEIPTGKTEVAIELYNFAGQLVSKGTYTIESGKVTLNLEGQPSGIYAAKIYLETPEYIKIIKK
ncbi:T9SS type A sorting domain-containing protein [Flavobacterium sp. JLP]|uniref:T9SS type A sorting domain-containing protein n=1 Tax=Flavobacterium sp. JLP TaxID=2783793 RepID=UPI00188C4EA1|nr:T9SS type A sorting domain-containing protein [Flavobacterium sp. JLP]MBF4506445.1 T9SS type A sorting domain-containing protein [Flavobacterium sp. JLP]